jgi:hypothetical protein
VGEVGVAAGDSRNKHVTGEWLSSWQPKNDTSGKWVSEHMTITPTFGKLRFMNHDNALDYVWEGVGHIKYKKHILGEWMSVKPGAHSKGTFMLTMSPQGNFMFGEIVGPNDNDITKSAPFVLGRSDADVQAAKRWLQNNIQQGKSSGRGKPRR